MGRLWLQQKCDANVVRTTLYLYRDVTIAETCENREDDTDPSLSDDDDFYNNEPTQPKMVTNWTKLSIEIFFHLFAYIIFQIRNQCWDFHLKKYLIFFFPRILIKLYILTEPVCKIQTTNYDYASILRSQPIHLNILKTYPYHL